MRLALQMWCLTSPPPSMITPLFLASTAWELIRRRSVTRHINSLSIFNYDFYWATVKPVYTIQPVVKPVWQPGKCLHTQYNRLSNPFDNRLYRVYKHPTGCQTLFVKPVVQPGLTTGWTNSCSFNMVVKPVWQSIGCLFTRYSRLSNRIDNRFYRVNGVLQVTVRPMLWDHCPVCPVLSVTLVYCGQMVGWINMPFGTAVGLGPGNMVRWGHSSPHKKEHSSPHFSAHVCCGQMFANLSNCWALVLVVVHSPLLSLGQKLKNLRVFNSEACILVMTEVRNT